jgi:exopolysaccharide biosynthesis polyprenyl glycosylphosphotransferase
MVAGAGSLMVRRHATALQLALGATDFLGAILLFVAVSTFRYENDWLATFRRVGLDPAAAALGYAIGWTVLVWLQGLYRPRARLSIRSEAAAVVRATIVMAVLSLSVLFLVRVPDFSRLLLLILFVSQVVLAVTARVVLRRLFEWLRSRGFIRRFVLVAGANESAQDFADRIERHAELGLRVIGHLTTGPDGALPGLTRPVLGGLDEIEHVLHRQVVDEVAVCLPPETWDRVEPLTRLCEEEGKIVRIPLDGRGPHIPGGQAEEFDGLTVLSLVYGPDRALSLAMKRVGDAALAALGLAILSPVLLIIALWLRRVDGAPAIFRQTRIGLHGRQFQVLKFRTMIPGAEEMVPDLERLNEIRGRAFKLTDDPRLTQTGAFLRRSSLDELPQLWNVLRGEMSLVGPRPPLPREVEGYDVWHRRRLSMKPGITGLWQVTARDNPDFDRWVEVDLEYIDRWSLWLDFTILLRTLPAVLAQQGR